VAEKGNVKLELERKQAAIMTKGGKRGLAIVVLQLVADDEDPEVPFGPMKFRIAFQIIENVELNNDANGTGMSYRVAARRLVQVVKPCALIGLTTEIVCDNPCIEPIALTGPDGKLAAGLVGAQVNFVTYEQTNETLVQVSTPQYEAFSGDGSPQVIITCATAGAEIWYTTDDTVPVPHTDGTKLYVDPIDIPAEGFVLRARAFQAGMIASQVARETATYE
jgi:hypothetical protein